MNPNEKKTKKIQHSTVIVGVVRAKQQLEKKMRNYVGIIISKKRKNENLA